MYSLRKLFYTSICQQIISVIKTLYLLLRFNRRFSIMQRLNIDLALLFTRKQMNKRKNKIKF